MVDFARGGRCSDFGSMDILSGGVAGGEGLAVVEHLRQSPFQKHLALSAGVSLEIVMVLTSMALGSFCGQGVKEEV